MKPSLFFDHCPRCGERQKKPPEGDVFVCAECQFTLYFSAANAAAAFISREDGQMLLVRRANEPAKGKLAPPGGFINVGETAEDGVRREVREEVGLELTSLEFLCSQPNEYQYKDVIYPVLDFFFTARASASSEVRALEEIESFCWLDPDRVRLDELAFPSMRAAFRVWLTRRMGR